MIVMTGRITTRILGATTIVGASFFATLLVTPALAQSAPEPFVPWLMKFFQPTAPVETATLPVPRPRPIQQPPKTAAAAQSNPLTPAVAYNSEQAVRQPPMTHQHEQYSQQQPIPRPREQANQQMPKFLLGPTMVSPNEQLIQPTRVAAAGPTTIAARAAVSNGDFDADLRLQRKQMQLVAPPYVHAHEQATRVGPKIIEVRLVVEEKDMVIDDAGTKIKAMTFNGTIPAPAIIVHEGDYVETALVNPST